MTARFFVDHIDDTLQRLTLPRDEAHHLSRVLRLQVGDAVTVFDAAGQQFHAVIEAVSSHGATLNLTEKIENKRAPLRDLTVAISPIRPDAMNWLVQKLTELGVARLAPFVSERTALPKAGDAESDESRRKRWGRISLAACKQCGRARPIEILPARKFQQQISELRDENVIGLFAWEGGDAQPIAQVIQQNQPPNAPATIIIGPEGGFTANEYKTAIAAGYQPVDLGPYILRAETAAITAAAIVLAF